MTGNSEPRFTVLLVEDDEIDIRAVQRALRGIEFEGELAVARSVDEGLRWICTVDRRADLVLLDVNLPERSGHEFLADLRVLRTHDLPPVVVITSSAEPRDLELCYAASASGYFLKSLDSADLEATLRTILDYWRLAKRPSGTHT